jgi:hypothetical protein
VDIAGGVALGDTDSVDGVIVLLARGVTVAGERVQADRTSEDQIAIKCLTDGIIGYMFLDRLQHPLDGVRKSITAVAQEARHVLEARPSERLPVVVRQACLAGRSYDRPVVTPTSMKPGWEG